MFDLNHQINELAKSKGWKAIPLKYVYKRKKELGHGTEDLLSIYRDYGVVPKNSRTDNFNKASDDLSKYQKVQPGDIVINKMKAWQGSVAVSDYAGIISPAYFIYEPQVEVCSRYIHYLLRSEIYFSYYASISSGVRPNQWDLDPSLFERINLLLPPFDEQKRIADELDHELTEIDAFIADAIKLQRLIEEREKAELEKNLVESATKFVELRRFNPRCISGTSVNAAPWQAGVTEFGVLKTGVVSKGYFDPSQNKAVIEESEISRLSVPVKANTIIVNRANSPELVGSAAYVEKDFPNLFLSDKLWQIDFEGTNNEHMAAIMQTRFFKEQVHERCVGASSSMQNLSYQDFLSIKIPIINFSKSYSSITNNPDFSSLGVLLFEKRKISILQKFQIIR